MTDGAARVLETDADEELRREIFPHLVSRDPEMMWTAGQWMTERRGGSDVSGTAGLDLDGREVRAGENADRRVLLLNWSDDCGFCVDLAPQLEELAPALGEHRVDVVLVGSGAAAFTGLGTPVSYLVDGDGRTESHLAMGAANIVDLARAAIAAG